MLLQPIDTVLAPFNRGARHQLYTAPVEAKPKLTAAQARKMSEACYQGHVSAVNTLDVPSPFKDVGHGDPTKAKSRFRFQFIPPQLDHVERVDGQLPMSAFILK